MSKIFGITKPIKIHTLEDQDTNAFFNYICNIYFHELRIIVDFKGILLKILKAPHRGYRQLMTIANKKVSTAVEIVHVVDISTLGNRMKENRKYI